jgi:hypothetical protein
LNNMIQIFQMNKKTNNSNQIATKWKIFSWNFE